MKPNILMTPQFKQAFKLLKKETSKQHFKRYYKSYRIVS